MKTPLDVWSNLVVFGVLSICWWDFAVSYFKYWNKHLKSVRKPFAYKLGLVAICQFFAISWFTMSISFARNELPISVPPEIWVMIVSFAVSLIGFVYCKKAVKKTATAGETTQEEQTTKAEN